MISLVIFAGCNTAELETKTALVYPETAKVDTVDEYFGHPVPDPYRWLEDDNSQETASWVTAQNEVTFDYLERIPFREKIKSRLEELWDYEKIYAPTKHGDFYYYYRNNGLQNQNVLFRRSEEGEEEVFLDPNNFSDDGTVSMAQTSFTTDGSMLAFMISEGGSDWRKAVVMKTADQEIVGDTLIDIKFSGIAWKGNEGFYYSSYDKPKDGSVLSGKTQRHKLFYHQLGSPQSEDKLVYGGDKQPRRYIGAYTTEDENYLVITAAESTSGNELIIMDLRQAKPEFLTVVDNFDQNHYVVANEDSRLLIHT
ncbi:MAG: S9 family peptidase, partial [Cyclobacteriaceae bacterium]|nr:S9 family peptidase [Cyclobacteriaceae bacterium]